MERKFVVAMIDGRAIFMVKGINGDPQNGFNTIHTQDGLLQGHYDVRTHNQVKPALEFADYLTLDVQVYELVPVDRDQFERGE